MRYIKTFGLAVLFAVQLAWLKYTRFLRGSRQTQVASKLYTRQAKQFVRFATQMGGLIVKLGQFMSVRIDLLPKEYIDELSLLQDALPPVPTQQIISVIETELRQPLDQLFTAFDQTPIAAASLGQVHKAQLPDGTPVAVKVLRPGIDKLVATDLRSLRALLRLVNHWVHIDKYTDLDALEADFSDTFTSELDYLAEGHNAEQFQRNLLMNMNVDVPQIYWKLSTRRVLTMEFMDGVPIDDLSAIEAAGIDRRQLAANLADIFFGMVLDDGFYHADPHPGNVFVRSDGIVQLLDFGMVGSITPDARREYGHLITALVRRDAEGIVSALRELGFLGPGADTKTMASMLGPYIDAVVGDVASFYNGASFVDSMMSGKINLTVDPEALEKIQQFIFSQPINLPGQTTFLGKAVITVIGLCLRLDPELDLIGAAGAHLSGGGSKTSAIFDLAGQALGEGLGYLKDALPTARRLIDLSKRLADGSFEDDMAAAVERRLASAQHRQTTRLVRTIAIATGVIVAAIRLRR